MASDVPQPPRRIRCYTRAVKNARFLKQQDPATFDRGKDADGFGTGVPVEILQHLHRLRDDSPELRAHPQVAEFLRRNNVPQPAGGEK